MAKMIRIVAKREGFRRAGIAHGTAAATYPLDRFSKTQLAALKAEPMLVVDEIEVADKKPAEGPVQQPVDPNPGDPKPTGGKTGKK